VEADAEEGAEGVVEAGGVVEELSSAPGEAGVEDHKAGVDKVEEVVSGHRAE